MKPSDKYAGPTAMDNVAYLPDKQRQELFAETAAAMKTVPAIPEKDFWVVWVLGKLFTDPELGRILQFKGGTSLSKVFDAIGRFSEDIDLILDWREVVQGDPHQDRTKTQQMKFNEATNAQAIAYIRETLLPRISGLLSPLCVCTIAADNSYAISVGYPSLFKTGYLRPEILLEIGPLASWSPSGVFDIKPYAAAYFPHVFSQPTCHVPTILAKRTFWEKVTILHQEAHRDLKKPMPPRYSRHYYDLALLAQSTVKGQALSDTDLLAEVVQFKQRFYPCAWARYDLAQTETLKLLPPDARTKEVASDYDKMQEMIFAKHLAFAEIIASLRILENEINALSRQA
ncbi:MAG: nucleotidyl transferase AbiEii/AbiGii toxin family protein [Desulfomicrobium apsheronum]|nr:nucleotidyl transferase AbiEii/AbiGii toxin family protein [Desulfomicrobium apsheronum]